MPLSSHIITDLFGERRLISTNMTWFDFDGWDCHHHS